jgi:alpha-beta hydrolase superfamily lysophospholipase
MQVSEWKWKSCDKLDLYARAWESEEKPKASIMLVHGIGEHVVRYDHVAKAMTDAGYAMLGFDLCGHGKSGGSRGYITSYEALMDDIATFSGVVDVRYPGIPRFIYGHSLGGGLVLNYILRRQPDFHGAIVTAPMLKLAFEPPAVQVALGKLMNGLLPAFTQHSKLNTKALSHDPAVVSAYENDPLVHDKVSARLFVEMVDKGQWALDHATEFPLPLLLMHGSADTLTSPKASQEFAEKAGDKVRLKIWDGLYHEIHNEPEKAAVFQVMIDWLGTH